MSIRHRPGGPPRRAMVRWSWRMFRKEWRQQFLVLSLVTIAVAIAVAGSTMTVNAVGSNQPEFGTAGAMARIEVTEARPASASIAAARARFGPVEVIGHQLERIAGVSDPLDLRSQDPHGRFASGTLALRSGRYPTKPGDVALTQGVADLLAATIGDRVELGRRQRTVVGIVENPKILDDGFALVAPNQGHPADLLTLLFARPGTDGRRAGRGAPRGGSGEAALQAVPVAIRGNNGPVAALILVAVALAMTLVGLIAAAAFVVVAQRRQRQLGLLAAIGAGERHLQLVVVANGAIVGLVAAVAGTALGLVGWFLAAPAVEQAANQRIDRFDLPWGILAGCFVVAVLMSTAAAWWPARRTSRMPVMAALSGRPPRPAPVHRSMLAATLLLGAGVVAIAMAMRPNDKVQPLLLIVGVLAVAVGTVFIAPAAIRVGAAPAGRLPLASRLALRDLARFQGRAAAALAAITFVVGISVTIVAISGANQYRAGEGNLSSHQLLLSVERGRSLQGPNPTLTHQQLADLDAQAARVATAIPGSQVLPLDLARPPTTADSDPARQQPISEAREVGDHSWNELSTPPIATAALLEHFGIDPGSIRPGTDLIARDTRDVVLLDITQRDQAATTVQHVDLPAYTSGPTAMITEAALARHGWVRFRSGWLLESPHALTTQQIATARARAARAGLAIETRSTQDYLTRIRAISTGIGALLALAIVAMTVGLIRSESARDVRTLTATGASSRTRRALTSSTAGALALFGVVLGTGGAYVALVAGYHRDLGRLVPLPWGHLAAIAIGLPLVAAGAGWLLAGREPKAYSRQTFD